MQIFQVHACARFVCRRVVPGRPEEGKGYTWFLSCFTIDYESKQKSYNFSYFLTFACSNSVKWWENDKKLIINANHAPK